MSAADQHKEKIICMLESISDEKFLNQIRTLLKIHIERAGHEQREIHRENHRDNAGA